MSNTHAQRLREALRLAPPSAVSHRRLDRVETGSFARELIEYNGLEGDAIRAFLFLPRTSDAVGGVVAFHQHNGEFHLGKSEVAGLVGDRHQAFGPALAARGIAVLAPDAVAFEDRRAQAAGVEPADDDWLQHYNAMAYRLVDGDILMRKCLDDAQRALSVLLDLPMTRDSEVGVIGHSYGGTTAFYHAALDERCRFVCASGAVCSVKARQEAGTGINVFEVVPGLTKMLEAHDLVRAISPREFLVVSATNDPYAVDADAVVARAGAPGVIGLRVEGEHPLDQNRFDAIVDWVVKRAGRDAGSFNET
jgi:dienelactone hydrolase